MNAIELPPVSDITPASLRHTSLRHTGALRRQCARRSAAQARLCVGARPQAASRSLGSGATLASWRGFCIKVCSF